MSRSAPKTAPQKLVTRTASVIAGLIFILFSSCAPSIDDQALNDSPNRRRTTASGDPAGASNDTQYGQIQFGDNQTGNSFGNQNNNSVNPLNNGIANGTGNNGTGGGGTSGNNNIINTNAECYKADEFVCKVERLIGEKTNKYRESRGLQPLALDSKIAFVSRDWSQKMSRSGFISHSGFPSSRVSVYRQEFNTSRSLRGENVAMSGRVSGSSLDDAAAERIAQEFAVMWWNSSGHRANMLGRFKSLGVGVHKTSRGSWYATQIFE